MENDIPPELPDVKSSFESDILSLLEADHSSFNKPFNEFDLGSSHQSELDSDGTTKYSDDIIGDSVKIQSSSDLSKLGTFQNGVFDPKSFDLFPGSFLDGGLEDSVFSSKSEPTFSLDFNSSLAPSNKKQSSILGGLGASASSTNTMFSNLLGDDDDFGGSFSLDFNLGLDDGPNPNSNPKSYQDNLNIFGSTTASRPAAAVSGPPAKAFSNSGAFYDDGQDYNDYPPSKATIEQLYQDHKPQPQHAQQHHHQQQQQQNVQHQREKDMRTPELPLPAGAVARDKYGRPIPSTAPTGSAPPGYGKPQPQSGPPASYAKVAAPPGYDRDRNVPPPPGYNNAAAPAPPGLATPYGPPPLPAGAKVHVHPPVPVSPYEQGPPPGHAAAPVRRNDYGPPTLAQQQGSSAMGLSQAPLQQQQSPHPQYAHPSDQQRGGVAGRGPPARGPPGAHTVHQQQALAIQTPHSVGGGVHSGTPHSVTTTPQQHGSTAINATAPAFVPQSHNMMSPMTPNNMSSRPSQGIPNKLPQPAGKPNENHNLHYRPNREQQLQRLKEAAEEKEREAKAAKERLERAAAMVPTVEKFSDDPLYNAPPEPKKKPIHPMHMYVDVPLTDDGEGEGETGDKSKVTSDGATAAAVVGETNVGEKGVDGDKAIATDGATKSVVDTPSGSGGPPIKNIGASATSAVAAKKILNEQRDSMMNQHVNMYGGGYMPQMPIVPQVMINVSNAQVHSSAAVKKAPPVKSALTNSAFSSVLKMQTEIQKQYSGKVYNVEFKISSRCFIANNFSPPNIQVNEFVVVAVESGEDIGVVTEIITMKQYIERCYLNGIPIENEYDNNMGPVLRYATLIERGLLADKFNDEQCVVDMCRDMIDNVFQYPMIIVDAEYQFDRHKLTVYFDAPPEVDFMDLVKTLFDTFKAPIWMNKVDASIAAPHLEWPDFPIPAPFHHGYQGHGAPVPPRRTSPSIPLAAAVSAPVFVPGQPFVPSGSAAPFVPAATAPAFVPSTTAPAFVPSTTAKPFTPTAPVFIPSVGLQISPPPAAGTSVVDQQSQSPVAVKTSTSNDSPSKSVGGQGSVGGSVVEAPLLEETTAAIEKENSPIASTPATGTGIQIQAPLNEVSEVVSEVVNNDSVNTTITEGMESSTTEGLQIEAPPSTTDIVIPTEDNAADVTSSATPQS